MLGFVVLLPNRVSSQNAQAIELLGIAFIKITSNDKYQHTRAQETRGLNEQSFSRSGEGLPVRYVHHGNGSGYGLRNVLGCLDIKHDAMLSIQAFDLSSDIAGRGFPRSCARVLRGLEVLI